MTSGHSLFFRANASCSKILNSENIFNTVHSAYIHLGVIRVIWASVKCVIWTEIVTGYNDSDLDQALVIFNARFFVLF